jgi:hypothetical protein
MDPQTLAYLQGLADTANALSGLYFGAPMSGTADATGGFSDAYGGYSDPYGGYSDAVGGYADAFGGYADPYGGYTDATGAYSDPATVAAYSQALAAAMGIY